MDTLRSCFTSAIEQRRALEAVGDFFQAVELNLYDASVCAFDPSSSGQEAFRCFMNIYNELSGPKLERVAQSEPRAPLGAATNF